jgi:hypothetical protein
MRLPRTAATTFGVRISMDSRSHPLLRHREDDLAVGQGDHRAARLLVDGDLGELAHRENGLAAQQDPHGEFSWC